MPTMKERRMIDGARRRDEWNAKHPPGTRVRFYPIRGIRTDFVDTVTRSEAWCLGHGEPVVLIEARAGGCALANMQPLGDDGRAA